MSVSTDWFFSLVWSSTSTPLHVWWSLNIKHLNVTLFCPGCLHIPTDILRSVQGHSYMEGICYIWVLYWFVRSNRTAFGVGLITLRCLGSPFGVLYWASLEPWGFPAGLVGAGTYLSPGVSNRCYFLPFFQMVLFQPLGFLTHMGCSVLYWIREGEPLQISGVLCLSSNIISSIFPCKF